MFASKKKENQLPLKTTEIFTPSKYPKHTFIGEHLAKKKEQLHDSLEEGATLISISGPSKSGKTVFIEESLGKSDLIQVTGAGVGSPNDLWSRVFTILGTPIPNSHATTESYSTSTTLQGKGEASALVFKGSASVELGDNRGKSSSHASEVPSDHLQLLIKELAHTEFVIFIDDFHYIPKDTQSQIARQIKEAIRNGVKFICASVPYHSDDVLRGNPDLRGRICSIDFDYWDSETLFKIAEKGFNLLNVNCPEQLIRELVEEAAGSPQLMQYLCLNYCRAMEIRESQAKRIQLDYSNDDFKAACKRTAHSTDYSSVVSKVIDGPKTRGSDRKVYKTTYGWEGDVYRLLLKAFSMDPPKLNFRYQDLVDRVNAIASSSAPSGSSITGACQHASAIANSSHGSNIVEWDAENDVFDIRDPYLLFYIRWSDVLEP